MKRTLIPTAFLAMGLLMAGSIASAQDAPAATSGGQVTIGLVGAPNVESSKFQEYRIVPKGASIPFMHLFSTSADLAFDLRAYNIRQDDQRYTGWADLSWAGLSFDYNQTPHAMGNDGHSIWAQTAPGVWSLNASLRKSLADAIDATATTGRIYPFYADLLSPAFASAGSVDIRGMRQRGEAVLDLGKKLPFDLKFSYMREVKRGNRGESGGTLYGVVNTVVDVPDAMNEVTTDYGVNLAYNFKLGNVHARFNRNIYNDRQDALVIDNPFRATDLAYTSASVPGGPARGRYSTAPSNEASRGAFGVLLKFARQTRIAADVALGTWTQNDQFLPYTINSAILTPAGTPANLASSLPQQSLNGKINTTTLNVSFTSRPIDGLGIRLRYRSYDQANKTTPITWPGNTGWDNPERAFTTAATIGSGFNTQDPYSNKTARFEGQLSYDFGGLTLEAAAHTTKIDRTFVEAVSGKDTGFALAAVFHASDWLGLRGTYNQAKQTASGYDATPGTYLGLPSNESERKTTRTGFDIELSPVANLDLTFAYFRRNDEYPNRPARGIGLDPGTTSSGLLSGKYDTFTAEIDFNPSERVELNAYYTYEKNLATDRNITLTSGAINNSLKYDASDKTGTFGANAVVQLVPEKWTLSLFARHQKVDGLLGVTAANQAGSFYTGRVLNGFNGTQPIDDWDDTLITTVSAQLDFAVTKAWTLTGGYVYEKYTFADAFTAGTSNFPVSPLIMLKPNDGNYNANIVFAKLGYRF
jgi:hypothetical protein